jgi:hypothetical protein
MSSASQAAGTNYVTALTVTSTGGISVRGWTRVNSWTKNNYGVVVDLGATCGITQDPIGATGNGQTIQGWAHGSGGFVATNNIATALGQWFFWCCVVSGNLHTVYWSSERGPLFSQSLAVDTFGATTDVRLAAEDTFNDELGDYSYREVVAWPGTVLTYAQVLQERNAGLEGPRVRAGARYLRALAAAPQVAAIGADWTLTGTFAVGVDEPRIARAPLVALGC